MSDRDYLDHLAKVTADIVTATIESRNEDGTYMVREIGSRALVRASKSNPVDEFAIGSRVVISRPDASRSVLGSGSVIISRAPRDQKGLAGTSPAESVTSHERPLIYGVDPDPLVLEVGGEAGVQTIIGRGLASAAVYVRRSALSPEPLVSNTAAPDVEPGRVIMSIAADADSPLGTFSLTIGSAIARDALRIVAAPPGIEPPYLLVSGTAELEDLTKLCVIWCLSSDTLELLRIFEVEAERTIGLAVRGAEIYWITSTGTTFTARTVNPATGAMTDAPIDVPSYFEPYPNVQLGVLATDKLSLANVDAFDKGLWSLTPANSEPGGTAWTGSWEWAEGADILAINEHDGFIYLTGPDGTYKATSAFSEEASAATERGARIIAVRAWSEAGYGAFTGQICTVGFDEARWLNESDLATAETYIAPGGTAQALYGPVQIEDRIYFLDRQAGSLMRATLDGVTVETVASLTAIAATIGATVTNGTDIYYQTTAGTMRRINVAGDLLTQSDVLTTTLPATDVALSQVIYVA